MPDEEVQERGREGVGMVKTWLEATTWMQFPFNAYEDKERCVALTITGRKKFDLKGWHLGDKNRRRGMQVECKRYSTKGRQLSEFKRFMAIAYSSHVKSRELYGKDWAEDFLWVTSNPFETDKWSALCTEKHMLDVLTDPAHEDVLGVGHVVDAALAREVVARIWLLVFEEEKQLSVTLTPGELNDVMGVLKREGPGLWQR